jgi:hypothetical protein
MSLQSMTMEMSSSTMDREKNEPSTVDLQVLEKSTALSWGKLNVYTYMCVWAVLHTMVCSIILQMCIQVQSLNFGLGKNWG